MDEDRLSPQLGRLIDQAKAAAQRADPTAPKAEGVALLTGDGGVHTGHPGADPNHPFSAAESALASARREGCGEVLAAAVAVANEPSQTALPSLECRQVLAGIDEDLPLVVKHQGRWVMLPLSRLPLSSPPSSE